MSNLQYHEACAAMQAGVALAESVGLTTDMTPKHLRVGVNSAMVDSGSLGALLVKKGVISEEEYMAAIHEQAAEWWAGVAEE